MSERKSTVEVREKDGQSYITQVFVDGKLIFESGDSVSKVKKNLKLFLISLDDGVEEVH